jgi:hypothetical protein
MDHTIKPDSQAHATAAGLFLFATYCHGNNWFSFIGNQSISRIKCFPNALPEECDILAIVVWEPEEMLVSV